LVKFRERMIAHDLDQQLLARTIELAKRTGKFGWQHLQAALDSSPLLGAGRIEDTWNLIGRALGTVVTCAAKAAGRPRAQVIAEAQLMLVDQSSLKAALDIDWDDPAAQAAALARLLGEVERIEQWVATQSPTTQATPALQEALTALRAVLTQDLEPDPTTGGQRILRGVAKGRQPSLGDPEMRHGRKSRSRPFTGYKRHVVKLREPDLIVEAVARPANEPEHTVLATLTAAVARHGLLTDLWMDRGYLASPEIPRLHARGVTLHAKPWTARNGERFPKHAFAIRLADGLVECPAHQTAPIVSGRTTVQFPAATCRACPVRDACTTAAEGRSIWLHPQEALLQELRATMRTPGGRADLRHRTTVEHSLARLDQTQGKKARYKGARKNTLDARRCDRRQSTEPCATRKGRMSLRVQFSRTHSSRAVKLTATRHPHVTRRTATEPNLGRLTRDLLRNEQCEPVRGSFHPMILCIAQSVFSSMSSRRYASLDDATRPAISQKRAPYFRFRT
jgi:hypothetical protein